MCPCLLSCFPPLHFSAPTKAKGHQWIERPSGWKLIDYVFLCSSRPVIRASPLQLSIIHFLTIEGVQMSMLEAVPTRN